MKAKTHQRILSLLLAVVTVIGLLPMITGTAGAADDTTKNLSTAQTSKILYNTASGHADGHPFDFLSKADGGSLTSYQWRFEADNGLAGRSAFCVEHGKSGSDLVSNHRISPYTANYKTMGAFANGFPTRNLTTFLSAWVGANPALAGLTEDEYAYATQVAIWATLGQLGVEGTSFTAGTEKIAVPPSGNTQATRVYTAVKIILANASGWTSQLKTKAYVKTEMGTFNNAVTVTSTQAGVNPLEDAAQNNRNGIKKETINGVQYFTREFIVASATSTFSNNYNLYITAYWTGTAPDAQGTYTPASGVIITDVSNNILPLVNGADPKSSYFIKVETPTPKGSYSDGFVNGSEYSAKVKVCIPVSGANAAGDVGDLSFSVWTLANQYNIYLAASPVDRRQDYIIGDPGVIGASGIGTIKWEPTAPGTGTITLVKYDDAANTLQGAEFELSGQGISPQSRTTDANGTATWNGLAYGNYIITETKAPDGYQIIAPITVTVNENNAAVQVSATDSSQHTFTVHKQDRQNGASLQGFTFRFEQINGSFKTDAVTQFDGNIVMNPKQLPFGSYKVFEVAAREGYILDATPQTVNWTGDADITLTFTNARKTGFKLLKVDSATNRSLPGAVFDVYKNGQLITSVTTNEDGTAVVSDLSVGYYEVEETSAPQGYILDKTRHGIYIDPYNPATTPDPVLTINNEARPSLIILKYDEQTGKPIPGTVFEVYHDAALIGEFTTNANGEILLSNLEPGTYLAREKTPAPGYVLNPTAQQIEVTANTTAQLIFLNFVKPGIHLIKLDSVTMKPLVNAKYLISQVGGTFAKEFTTDQNGEIDLTGLEPGAYTVVETLAPNGYLIDNGVRIIQINAGENAQFVFTDTAKPTLEVVKYDPVADKYLGGATFRIAYIADGAHYLDRITDVNGKITITDLLPGVYSVQELAPPSGYILNDTEYHVELFPGKTSQLVVENIRKPSLIVWKYDEQTAKPLPNAEFSVAHKGGSVIHEGVTNGDGFIRLDNLDEGWYTVTEMAPPPGYLNSVPASRDVYLEPGKTAEIKFDNLRCPTLTVYKKDSITGDPIKGVKMNVKFSPDVNFSGGVVDLGTYITDENGRILLNDSLKAGWYRVTELEAAHGYILKVPMVQDIYLKGGEDKALHFENIPKSALIIRKTDSAGLPVPGATFTVKYLAGTSGSGGTLIKTAVTSVNGTITLTGLDPGTYVVEETIPAPGYQLSNPAVQTAFITDDEQSIVELVFTNPKMGRLVLKKLDSGTKQPIKNATFKVTDSSGAVIGPNSGEYITDAEGLISIAENLPIGSTVIVQEIKAPDNYIIDTTEQSVKIMENTVHTLTFYNTPKSGAQLIKLDEDTRVPIPNTQFTLSKMNGERIGGIYVTDSAGVIRFPELDDGWYTVTEAKAAKGYILDTTPHNIEVKNGKTAVLTVTNKKSASVLLRKIDSVTGKGIYGVVFLLSDENRNPVGEYITDQDGYIWLDGSLRDGKYFLREVQPAAGYLNDNEVKTIYITGGKITEITWKNTPNKGQIVITKLSYDYNAITNLPANSPLAGAVFEVRNLAGNLVETITSDSRGIAATRPLAPGVYVVTETSPPPYYTGTDKELIAQVKHDGDIVRFTVYNKAITIGVTVDKKGNNQVQAGQIMRYDLYNVGNTSSVPLDNFYLHDRLPTDAVRITKLFTGTWNQRLNYSVYFKTNYKDYRVLASGLQSHINYELSLHPNVLGLAAGEYVTDVRWEFGTVNAGFKEKDNPFLFVQVLNGLTNGYSIINRADVGGKYLNEWQTARTTWLTTLFGPFTPPPTLPKTGY